MDNLKGNGGIVRGIRNRLKAKLKGKPLQEALAALLPPSNKNRSLPRKVSIKAHNTIKESGSAVIVLGRSGKLKVFSLEGHRALSENMRKKHRQNKIAKKSTETAESK